MSVFCHIKFSVINGINLYFSVVIKVFYYKNY